MPAAALTQEIVIRPPDREEIAQEYSPLVARAEAVEVASREDHETAQRYLSEIAGAKKRVEERLDPIVRSAHQTHKALTVLRRELLKPLDTARQVVSRKLDAYEAEERRRAEQARRKAEAEARRREEERRLQDAIEAEEAGDSGQAEEILAEEAPAPVVHVEPETARVEGVHSQQRWNAEVVDLAALVRYVAEHPEWIHLLQPDTTALNGLARSQKGALRIPGVRAVAKTVRAVRSA